MYRTGHYGAALITLAPVMFVLLLFNLYAEALLSIPIVMWLTRVPDWDMWLPGVKHRGFTHTFLFAGIVGLIVGGIISGGLYWLSTSTSIIDMSLSIWKLLYLFGFGFGIGVLAIVAHIAADSITPMGVRPLQPFNDRLYSFDITPAKDPVANTVLAFVGGVLLVAAMALAVHFGGFTLFEVIESALPNSPDTIWDV